MNDLSSTARPMDLRQEVAIFRGVPEPRHTGDPLPGGMAEMARFRLVGFGGLAHTARGVLRATVKTRTLPDWSLADLIGEGGQWWGIFQHAERTDEYVIATDAYHYGYLPWTWHPGAGGTLCAGNNFQGIIGALADEGVQPEVNWPLVLTHLASHQAFFNQLTADETFARGVFTLRPGQLLHITGHGTWVRHRDYFTGDYTSGDYDKLLDAGIERSIAQIQQLAALDVPERRIYLSGGRDSRQVMAMVAAAGVADKFTICSTNPRTWPGDAYSRKVVWADFNVSNVIRKKYGMKWAADGEFAGHPANFEEVLQFWQSHRSNQMFSFTGRREQFFPVDSRIEVRGAGGEAYRDFWSAKFPKLPWYGELQQGPEHFQDDLLTSFTHMVPKKLLREDDWQAGFETYRDTLTSLSTEGFDEAVDLHFTAFRQRAHFGHGLQSLGRNGMIVFPPSQPEWVIAGQFLSQAERKSGLICFDIIERVMPELNEIPFDSDQWSDELWRRRPGGKPVMAEVPPAEDDCDDYWEIEERSFHRRHHPTQLPTVTGLEARPWGLLGSARPRAQFDIDCLRQAPGGDAITPELVAYLQARLVLNEGAAGMVLGKLESTLDVLVHRRRPSEVVEFQVGDDGLPPVFGWNVNGARMGCTPVVARAPIPPSEPLRHSVAVGTVDEGVRANATVEYPMAAELEYAFYLYDTTRKQVFEKLGYRSNQVAVLHPPKAGEYIVRSFIRAKATPHLVFTRDSAKVTWEGPVAGAAASLKTARPAGRRAAVRKAVRSRLPEAAVPGARAIYRTVTRKKSGKATRQG